MIPKVIHYCWFGGAEKPALVKKCIESWRKQLPDYKIQEWNESNYDFSKHPYTARVYKEKKWAFLSDYARLDIIYKYGGIYFDTDVEVLKSFDRFLEHHAFCGMETTNKVATGLVLGAEANNEMIRLLRDDYNDPKLWEDASKKYIACPIIQTNTLMQYGFLEKQEIQDINGLIVYPSSFFCPRTPANRPINTPEAYSIHYYAGTWIPLRTKLKRIFLAPFGEYAVYLVKAKSLLTRLIK